MFRWDGCTLRRPSPSVLGFAFRRAKTDRDRDLGRSIAGEGRTIVDSVPKAISRWETPPPLSAPKNKEAGGRLYFSSRPTPCRQPSASWRWSFATMHLRARPPAPFYRLAGPATWDACSIVRKHEDYRDECPKSEGPARKRSGGAGSGCEARQRGRSSLCATGLFSVSPEFCPYKPHVGAFVGEDVSDVFDIAYRDMSDTVLVASFDFHFGGYTIVV